MNERQHASEPTNEPWKRIHMDFAGPLKGCWYLIIVYPYTKWVKVFQKKTITTDWSIKQLEKLFITLFGLAYVLASERGKQFTSQQ